MITTLNQFILEKNEHSNFIQTRYSNGECLLNGTNQIVEANLLDLPGIRIELTLDTGFLIRISDDYTIYLYINGESPECRFDEIDTESIIDFIERSSELYDYPGIKPVIIEVLQSLQINTNESINNVTVLYKNDIGDNLSTIINNYAVESNKIENKVKSNLISILMDENNISEKDFKKIDFLNYKINNFIKKTEFTETVKKMNLFRPEHIAEEIYARYFSNKYNVKPTLLQDPIMKGYSNVN